jgi:signal peptidase
VIRTAAVAALVVLSALMLVPAALGFHRYVITGGSMGTALPRGSIAYERLVPVGRLRVGDVITYRPPDRAGRVTHRIVAIAPGGLSTKGDANATADPWRFRLSGRAQAAVAFHVPLVGYAFAALSVRALRIAVIGVPALLVAAASLAGIRRSPEMAT